MIVFMPVPVTGGAVLGVFMPDSWPIWEWVIKLYESIALWKFASLIVLLCGGEQAMLTDLAGLPMRKVWANPPCCCFFHPCMDKQVFTERDFKWVFRFIYQFIYLTPVLFFILMVVYIAEAPQQANLVINLVATISTLWCMYGLITLYLAVHHLPGISEANIVSKFFVIKLVVFLSTLQTLVIDSAVEAGEFDKGYEEDNNVDVGNIVKCFLIAIEAPFIATLAWRAFPGTDLTKDDSAVFGDAPLMDNAFLF